MSYWGYFKLAPHVYLLISNYITLEECQDILFHEVNLITSLISNINYTDQDLQAKANGTVAIAAFACAPLLCERQKKAPNATEEAPNATVVGKEIKKIRANLRIGAQNKDILSILFGSLLGDAQAEFRLKGNGTRITFYQEGSHVSYLIWLHKFISELGYCNTKLPKITTRLGKKGVVRKIIIFNT
jgi:LAGLIDADG DNA endonuclease family